ARLLINERGNRRPWVGLRLVGPDGIRDQYGARVALLRQGEAPLWRRVRADASYCSANDPRVLAGLGGGGAAVTLRVLWPDGTREDFPPVSPGRYTLIRQGSGKAVK
ncbi:MAG: ASPIC/UnbV domain-containing protein, partial [Planctomycetota bacterium]